MLKVVSAVCFPPSRFIFKADISLSTIAADILRLLHPHTEILDLGWNHQLGHKGLKALVQGMMAREEPEWRLKKIDLSNCELGGASKYVSSLTSS